MQKDTSITIKDWYKGMVSHPIAGFGLVENADVFNSKGIIKPTKGFQDSGLTTVGLPIAYQVDRYGNYYYAVYYNSGVGGVLYKNGTSLGSGFGYIYDIKIYKDYLWIRHEVGGTSRIAAYGPLNSSPGLFTSLLTSFTTNSWGQLCVGQDDYLYTTNGNLISKLEVTASGTPGVAPTIIINTSLDLKDGEVATCIAEYGTKIAVGTTSGKVYTWNRQAGTLGNPGLADLPVDFKENGVWQLLSHKNTLYVTAGRNGNIYVSDGTNYRKLAKIPYTERFITGGGNPAYLQAFVSYYPNAITINGDGRLLVGNVSSNTVAEVAVWEIDTDGSIVLHSISPGKTSLNTIGIGFIYLNTSDNAIKVGWYDGSSDGIDENSITTTGTTYTFESPLFRVGTSRVSKTFQHLDISLPDTLSPDESTTFSYRKNSSDSWTTIGTLSYATHGAVDNWSFALPIASTEKIQIKGSGNISILDLNLS